VERYDRDGGLVLQIEAKKDAVEVERLAAQMHQARHLGALPSGAANEIEYVHDLTPKYLWIVRPSTVDRAAHVFTVTVQRLDAGFKALPTVPHADFPQASPGTSG
jgi:hypothetical protein